MNIINGIKYYSEYTKSEMQCKTNYVKPQKVFVSIFVLFEIDIAN